MLPHVKENFDINLFLDCDKIVILCGGNNGTFCLTYNFGKIIVKYAVINSQVSH